MKSGVCTLFEKHYHFGLAALINSLQAKGYTGGIFVGYRGELPKWTDGLIDDASLDWPGARTLHVNSELKVHFLPVEIDYQFTNYKPAFMLKLYEGLCSDYDALAYFDPDITVRCQWSFFETWMSHGVAMVHEIISNDMSPSHPIRREWEKVIHKCGEETRRDLHSYINAGFCGVAKEYKEFLFLWAKVMEVGKSDFSFDAVNFHFSTDRSDIFFAKDQDAMNITAMCCASPISEMGPEGMDFIHGGFTMSHAVGKAKPWKKKYISAALKGKPASKADKAFWSHLNGPIKPYPAGYIRRKKIALGISGFIGRFYTKN